MTVIYQELIEYAKSLGLPVVHRKLAFDYGRFLPNHKIVISNKLKNTKEGCAVLAHEIFHYLDKRAGKFPRFYYHDRLDYTKKNFRMVVRAEQSASRGAAKFLRNYGLQVDFEELTHPEVFYDYWRKEYFFP